MDSYTSSADWSADLTSLYPTFDSDCFALESSTEQMIASLYPSPPLFKAHHDHDLFALDSAHLAASSSQPALRRARSSGALPSSSSAASRQGAPAYPMTTPSSSWTGSPASDGSVQTPPGLDAAKSSYFAGGAGAYGESDCAPVASTSYLPPSEPMVPTASIEEVNQFLDEMTSLLGQDAMASLSPVHVSPAPSKPTATYNVSGVLLDEADLAAFSSPAPPHTSSYRHSYLEPSFAPPIQTHQPYGYGSDPTYNPTHGPYPPRTPTRASFSAQRPRQLRRPSSIELMQALPRSAPGFYPQHQHPHALVGMGVYLPTEHTSPTPAPQLHPTHPQAQAAQPSHAGPQRTVRKIASMPNTRVHRKKAEQGAAVPAVPGVPKVVRRQPSGSCFINFSASDSKALLSGVAPSGSSKRRREGEAKEKKGAEEEEAKKVKA